MKTFKQFVSESFVHPISDDSYVYHRSNASNHESIKKHGLLTKQMTAKNGVKFTHGISFASKKKDTDGYADGDSHLYRVKTNKLKEAGKDRFSGYVHTEHDVHPSHLEYHDGKKWKKLSD